MRDWEKKYLITFDRASWEPHRDNAWFVEVYGPDSDCNEEGDEIPVWTVTIFGQDRTTGCEYELGYCHIHDYDSAMELGRTISGAFGCDLSNEAMPA